MGIAVTLGIAIGGWRSGNRADMHADEALTLARSAEARADRLERLAVERRDVTWICREETQEAGWLKFVNPGSDTAQDVRLLGGGRLDGGTGRGVGAHCGVAGG